MKLAAAKNPDLQIKMSTEVNRIYKTKFIYRVILRKSERVSHSGRREAGQACEPGETPLSFCIKLLDTEDISNGTLIKINPFLIIA